MAGRVFDLVWLLYRAARSRSCTFAYVWNGSDVHNALADTPKGFISQLAWKTAARDRHVAAAPWLVEMLKGLGVSAAYCPLPMDHWEELRAMASANARETTRSRLRIATYINERKHEFYGSREIVSLAANSPHAEVHVIGDTGQWCLDAPENLIFHGWVQDVGSVLRSCDLFVRLVPHDGMPHTIRQALLLGLHAIYSMPFPYTTYVPYGAVDELMAAVHEFWYKWESGELGSNDAGAEYVLREHDPTACASRLWELLAADVTNTEKE